METAEISVGSRLGDLHVEEVLGRGAFAVVYAARDEVIGRRVALKVIHDVVAREGGRNRQRMLQEARLVGGLNHPHIVTLHRVHALGSTGVAFEMEYVPFGTLEDLIGRRERLRPATAAYVARAIASALAAAHARGIVHRDVKPANVLLGSDRQVKLADFGLGATLAEAALVRSQEGAVAGTPFYMAPEAVMGEPTGPTADVWSLGVVLYEMLVGTPPFRGSTLPRLFQAIQNAEMAPLPADVPPALAHTVEKALRKRPADRFADGSALLEALQRDRRRAAPSEALIASAAAPRSEVTLVGRGDETRRLEEIFARAVRGQGACALVVGEAGVGKTAVLEEAGRRAETQGFLVLDAHARPGWGLSGSILEAVRVAIVRREGAGAALEPARWGRAAELVGPEFLRGDPRALPSNAQGAWVAEELLRVLARDEPVLLRIEDGQAFDRQDVETLKALSRQLASAPVVLLLTYRTHDPDESGDGRTSLPSLTTMADLVLIDLAPLSDEDIVLVAEREVGGAHLPGALAPHLVQEAGGNPLFALELLRHMLNAGVLHRSERGLELTAPLDAAAVPRRVRDLFERRLTDLSAEERELLEVAAVDGVDFEGEAVAAALERPLLDVLRRLQRLHRERGVLVPTEHGFRFTHTLLAECLRSGLAPALRQTLHRRLAEWLEARPDRAALQPERLGIHWEKAGEADRAAPWLLRAAETAVARQEHHRALALTRRAGLFEDGFPLRDHATIALGLVGSLIDTGANDEAARLVDRVTEAARAADDAALADRCTVWRNDVAFWARGPSAVDAGALDAAARGLGREVPEAGRAHFLIAVAAKLRGDTKTAHRHLDEAATSFASSGHSRWHASVLHEQGMLNSSEGRVEEAATQFQEAARSCERLGLRMNAAVSQVLAATSDMLVGNAQRAAVSIHAAVMRLEALGAGERAAHARVYLARAQYAAGDRRRAHATLEASIRRLEAVHSPYGLSEALADLALHHVIAGEGAKAQELMARVRRMAQEIGIRGPEARCDECALLWAVRARDEHAIAVAARAALDRALASSETGEVLSLARAFAEAGLFGLEPAWIRSILEVLTDRSRVRPHEVLEAVRACLLGSAALSEPATDREVFQRAARGWRDARHDWRTPDRALFAAALHARAEERSAAGVLALAADQGYPWLCRGLLLPN